MFNCEGWSHPYPVICKIKIRTKSTQWTSSGKKFPHWKIWVRRRWTNAALVYCISNFTRFCLFLSSISYFVLSKSTWGEQPVEDIPIFTCICVYVYICISMYLFVSRLLAKRKTIQTWNSVHTLPQTISKNGLFCFFKNETLRTARPEKLQCHVDFRHIFLIA